MGTNNINNLLSWPELISRQFSRVISKSINIVIQLAEARLIKEWNTT